MTNKTPLQTIEYLLFVEAWIMLALARIVLIFVPFRKLISFIKSKSTCGASVLEGTACLEQISVAIIRSSRRFPWRAKCFEQALAAKMMLGRRNLQATISFGVTKNCDKFTAHAWVDCYGIRITGGENTTEYTLLATF